MTLLRTKQLDLDRDRGPLRSLRDIFRIYIKPPDYALVFVATQSCHGLIGSGIIGAGSAGSLKLGDLFNARTFLNRLGGV